MNIEEKNKLFESLSEKFKQEGFSDNFINTVVSDIKNFVDLVESKIDNIIKNNEKVITEQISTLTKENKKLKYQNLKYRKIAEKIGNKSKNIINKIADLVNESITSMSINYNEKLFNKNVKLHKLNRLLNTVQILESQKRKNAVESYNEKISKIVPKIVKETIEYTKRINNKKYIELKKNILEKVNDYIKNYTEIEKPKFEKVKQQVTTPIIKDNKQAIKEKIEEKVNKEPIEQKKINQIIDLSSPTEVYVNKEILNESILTENELNTLIKSSASILNETEQKELTNIVNKEKNNITKSRFKQLVEKIKSDFENKYMTELANNMTSYDVSVVTEIINEDNKNTNDLVDLVAEQLKQNSI